jgi:hypothetical protein
MSSGPPCQAFWNAEAVFDATVLDIGQITRDEAIGGRNYPIADRLVRLDVRAAYKGVSTGPLDVRTTSGVGSCGYDFKIGGRYLVFATKSRDDGAWHVSRCSATQPIDSSGDAEDFLASLSQPARGGRIFGLIRGVYDPFAPRRDQKENPLNATLRLSGGGREQTSASTNGRFEFSGLAPGPYRLEIVVPKGFTTYGESRSIDLPNDRACRQEDFGLSHAGRITGVVLTAAGRPARVDVEVTRADAKPTREYGLLWVTGRYQNDGAFEVTGLSPGDYILGVNLENDPPSQSNPYPRTVYPGDGTGDMVITIGLDQTYDIGVWRLPPVPAIKNRTPLNRTP